MNIPSFKLEPERQLHEMVDLSEEDKKYLKGKQNFAIRCYFYLENGLNILNEFRNLGFLLAALYLALHLDGIVGILITSAMVPPAMLILIIVGRYNVHKLSKMKEWLSVRFSTHYGIRAFDYQKRQVELLEEIREMLKKQQDKNI